MLGYHPWKYLLEISLVLSIWECTTKASYLLPKESDRVILIDADPGLDDSYAIFMAVAAHKARETTGFFVIGFTTVCGNTDLKNVNQNFARTLEAANEYSIPIYKGASSFLVSPFKFHQEPPFFGQDGFGDAMLPPVNFTFEKEHAVLAIIRLAQEYKGRLTIITLGPLTNLALAIKLKPEIKDYIKEIHALGGNMDAVGNARIASEFNFFADPEAVAVTLESYRNITIMPLETFVKSYSPLSFRLDVLGKLDTPQMKLEAVIEVNHLRKKISSGKWGAPDAILMACVINPSVIRETKEYYAQIELTGSITRGMLVLDKINITKSVPNAKLITEIDRELEEKYLLWAVGGLSAI